MFMTFVPRKFDKTLNYSEESIYGRLFISRIQLKLIQDNLTAESIRKAVIQTSIEFVI
ncbi:hypothetical protein Riv7116_6435 [Rivularia sp. PCC 7116]|nr:hypothetical protein Riv7116_6435 [Rivularia sp. PCC 7116]